MMTDLFQQLPPEVLLPIFAYLPDLDSLDSLLQASPAAFRVFDVHSAEIFEAVLSSGAIHEFTCALIRITALIRSSSLPPEAHDWQTCSDFVRHETTQFRWYPPKWTLRTVKLSSAIPATILRGACHSSKSRVPCYMLFEILSASIQGLEAFTPCG